MADQPEPKPFTAQELERAPWLKVALGEYTKGVHEIASDKQFGTRTLFIVGPTQQSETFSLLDWKKLDREIAAHAAEGLAPVLMSIGNPDIEKYFRGVQKRPDHFTKKDILHNKQGGVAGHE